MHQKEDDISVSAVSLPASMWELHDPADTMRVTRVATLCTYALDGETKNVLWPRRFDSGEDIRVYGPEDKLVVFEVPQKKLLSKNAAQMLRGLVGELTKAGKIGYL